MPLTQSPFRSWSRAAAILAVTASSIVATGGASQADDLWLLDHQAQMVRMFDRPPTAAEVQALLMPPAGASRSIEIVGAAGATAARHAPVPIPVAAAMPSPPPQQAQPMIAEPAAKPASDSVALGFRISFGFNSAVVPEDALAYIDAVGAAMLQEPSLSVVVEGHTDAVGSDAYNRKLSERRADAVKSYLVQAHGIEAGRIRARGKGEGEPLSQDPNDGLNRRVQFQRAG